MKQFIAVCPLLLFALFPAPGFSQLAYESSRQGVAFKVYIINKQAAMGSG